MKQAHADLTSRYAACLHLQELRELIAVKNCMFAEEQSDIHEFFQYILTELSTELSILTPEETTSSGEQDWEEVGSGGRRLVINEARMDEGILTSLFETQLRKQVRIE